MRSRKNPARAWTLAALALLGLTLGSHSRANDTVPPIESSDGNQRNFYEVLEDVLGDFEYDLKNGAVTGLKDLSIRNIATSENIPASFKSHLELLVTERVLRNAKTRMIQCLPCKARKTTLSGDQVTISSPDTNPAELARIAKLTGISNFMDIAFGYQPTGIVLSMYIVEPESGAIIWSRSYNSETSRAAAYRKGVDFSQVDEARKQTEYQPVVQYRATVYYLFEPNVEGTTGVLGFGFRMMERYDNRKKEVGFELDYLLQSSSIVGGTDDTTTSLYSGLNLTLLFMHAWNLIGTEENFNLVRSSLFIGVGGTYASGFLGALVRTGFEWRLGKHYAVTPTVGYRPASTAFVGGTSVGSVGGVEFGLGISMLF
ncbi:MAG TPA: hypothetical protein VM598_00735 [Bdellovibrionota bacterium]|nr:hypothetical protein [Bdellovibrionota bacterium]